MEPEVKVTRTAGSRNRDFDDARRALLARVAAVVLARPEALDSFSELAQAAGVARPTLRHYFGDHDVLIVALMAHWCEEGAQFRLPDTSLPAEEAVGAMVRHFLFGWRYGLGKVLSLGIRSGLGHPTLGPAFVTHLLEPALQDFERMIAAGQARGELAAGDTREAAIALLSPVLVALLHQDALGGVRCRPLDVDAFTESHLTHWLRAWAPGASTSA